MPQPVQMLYRQYYAITVVRCNIPGSAADDIGDSDLSITNIIRSKQESPDIDADLLVS